MRSVESRSPVTKVVAGAAVGQLVVIVTMPVITRLYEPHEFGLLAVITAISAIGGVFVSLRLDMALPLADNDNLAAGVAWAAILSCLILSPVVTILALIGYAMVAGQSPGTDSAPTVAIAVMTTVLLGLTAVAVRWLGRDLKFGSIGRLNVAQGWLQTVTQLALSWSSFGLLLGLPAGRAPSVGVLFVSRTRPRWPGWILVGVALKRFKVFPLVSSWGALINTAGLQAPPLLLGIWTGGAVVGSFMLAQRLLALPTVMLAQAVSEVNYSELGRLRRTTLEPILPTLLSTLSRCTIVAVPLFAAAALIAPKTFGLIFGAEWSAAGTFVALLCPGMAAQFIVIPISRTLLLLERQGVQIGWETARLLLIVGVMAMVASNGGSSREVVLALSCSQAFAYTSLLVVSLYVSRGDDRARATAGVVPR